MDIVRFNLLIRRRYMARIRVYRHDVGCRRCDSKWMSSFERSGAGRLGGGSKVCRRLNEGKASAMNAFPCVLAVKPVSLPRLYADWGVGRRALCCVVGYSTGQPSAVSPASSAAWMPALASAVTQPPQMSGLLSSHHTAVSSALASGFAACQRAIAL